MLDPKNGKAYTTLREVLGICPKGTKVTLATDQKTGEVKLGTSGETYLFSLANGGGVFLKEDEVTLG